MEIKNDLKEDALGNLYRAALYFGRGSKNIGLEFFDKAKMALGERIALVFDNKKDLKKQAEKVLDEYKRIKFNLPQI